MAYMRRIQYLRHGFQGIPRYAQNALEKSAKMGYDTFNAGPECEFSIPDHNEETRLLKRRIKPGIDLGPVGLGEMREEVTLTLEEMGFSVEHHTTRLRWTA